MGSKVLVVDDDYEALYAIKRILSQKGFTVYAVSSPQDVEEHVNNVDVIVMDIRLPGITGVDLVEKLREKGTDKPVVFITACTDADMIVHAIKLGAVELLKKPFDTEELHKALVRALEMKKKVRVVCENEYKVVSVSKAMFEVFKLVGYASTNDMNVLITGETGVGKEEITKLIYANSGRKGPFVHVNCTSIPWDLFEAELFGYVKGAFTGATTNKGGKAKLAEGGTLFLDEIGDLPYKLQAKLLTFAEKKFFYPIGSNTEVKVDVRLIFATNRNLKDLVREEKFREDLYHRINQIEIHIPPLRERKEDIEPLINHFISLANRNLGLSITGISKQAFEKALNYSWPGNVRELKNVIYKAAIDTKVGLIKDLPITQGWEHQKEPLLSKFLEEYISSKKEEEMEQAFEDLKIAFVKKLLERYGGNKSKVARLLNISRNTLNFMLKED